MKYIHREQFSFTQTSIEVSQKILVYVFHFVSRLPGVCFFKDELEARKSFKAFFYSQNMITKYSLERFLFFRGKKMTKGFLKFYKLIIKPDTRSEGVSKTKTSKTVIPECYTSFHLNGNIKKRNLYCLLA